MKTLPDRLMVRNGTFYFRLWIPKDIVPVYGRQLVVTSLRTKDLRTAKTRLARKTVEAEEQFGELRSKNQGANGANEATPAASGCTSRCAEGPQHGRAAYTLRYIPAREDRNQLSEFRKPTHPQRVAIEACPEGQPQGSARRVGGAISSSRA